MKRKIVHIALIVQDYDEAIQFYTEKLNFELVEDTVLSLEKRWVLVSPDMDSECSILLAKASNEEQLRNVGNQTGGRVFLFLQTFDFENDYAKMVGKGVNFVRKPNQESYGMVAVFEDLYGNLWDLIEYSDIF